ncbi:hypothetical protein PGT21_027290 [Puccinia graminis f. sp. tritici]|uniref:Uncharacterized protein n=1 Tax=Puccinia graminis f. sp. tritici TaxID=56615 RepID=A0A5B0QVS0_PUCGR|nr:hypothetical protein PGT21_027290 [Puccinia graminis f. sp. tritici]KAA1116993.1 hypothetical protein PGTUg99_033314 [Puccinia graminis f. sp. tritici]
MPEFSGSGSRAFLVLEAKWPSSMAGDPKSKGHPDLRARPNASKEARRWTSPNGGSHANMPTLLASPSFGGSLCEGRLRQPGTGPPIEGLAVKLGDTRGRSQASGSASIRSSFCVDSTPASMWAPNGHKVKSTWSLESPISKFWVLPASLPKNYLARIEHATSFKDQASVFCRLAKDKDPHQRILDEAEANFHHCGIDVSNKPTCSTSARMWDCGTNVKKKSVLGTAVEIGSYQSFTEPILSAPRRGSDPWDPQSGLAGTAPGVYTTG